MVIVSWPQIPWRHFTLYVSRGKLNGHSIKRLTKRPKPRRAAGSMYRAVFPWIFHPASKSLLLMWPITRSYIRQLAGILRTCGEMYRTSIDSRRSTTESRSYAAGESMSQHSVCTQASRFSPHDAKLARYTCYGTPVFVRLSVRRNPVFCQKGQNTRSRNQRRMNA